MAGSRPSVRIWVMKVTAKQIDEVVRLFGTLAAACVSGAAIGAVRPEQVTQAETLALALNSVVLLGCVFFIRRKE